MDAFAAGEFLQGYLEEAGEHLQNINRNLLRLEETGGQDFLERAEILREIFRSCHTLKGLSGMVGLAPAVQLSHALETVLHAVEKSPALLDQALIDHLFQATRVLSTVVDSLRKPGEPVPDIGPTLASLAERAVMEPGQQTAAAQSQASQPVEDLLPGLATYPDLLNRLDELDRRKIVDAARKGQSLTLVMFSSSAERAARGENVDRVRQEIQENGVLIKAVPSMAGGSMRFLFLAAFPHPVDSNTITANEVIPLAVQSARIIEPAAKPTSPGRVETQAPVVRVELSRLDDMMRYTGDLLQLRSRLGQQLGQLNGRSGPVGRELQLTYEQIGRTLRDLRRSILHARMVPLAEAFNHMPLVVRDLARASQKEVNLVIQGENTEVDKLLVERLLDPLMHLVRNAITHGLESPDERVAAGKPARGLLALRGRPEGDHIIVEVEDDGRGLDLQQIASRAAELGWWRAGQPISAAEAFDIIVRPGFSTRTEADHSAGRGMGLDVVQRMVRAFSGRLFLETIPNQGTIFRLRLPLTLVVSDVFLVQAGQERYAIPRDVVRSILEIDPGQIVTVEDGRLLPGADGSYVLYRLDQLVRAASAGDDHLPRYGLALRMEDQARGVQATHPLVLVDRVVGMQEVVVRTLNDPLVTQPGIEGATELGDGSIILILDIFTLLRQARRG